MQITRSTALVPCLEQVCYNEDFGSKKIEPGSLEEKRKEYLENLEAIPEYDFVTDKDILENAEKSIPLD